MLAKAALAKPVHMLRGWPLLPDTAEMPPPIRSIALNDTCGPSDGTAASGTWGAGVNCALRDRGRNQVISVGILIIRIHVQAPTHIGDI